MNTTTTGADVAIEAAHIALMRDDWTLVPEIIRITHRTIRVVKINLWFTAVYNLGGLLLASIGLLPPTLAAAQSLPDLGILANSSRLLYQKQAAGESKGSTFFATSRQEDSLAYH